MNEWIAFRIVVVICGVRAMLANRSGEVEPPPGENDS
jgi:hypothetical protein